MNETIFDPAWYPGRTLYKGGEFAVTDVGWGLGVEMTASPLIARACSEANDRRYTAQSPRVAPWARILGATGSDERSDYQSMPLAEWQKLLALAREYGLTNLGDYMSYGQAHEDEPWPWETVIDHRGCESSLPLEFLVHAIRTLGYDGFLTAVPTYLFTQHPGYGDNPRLWEPQLVQAFAPYDLFPVLVVLNDQAYMEVDEPMPAVDIANPFGLLHPPSPPDSLAPALAT